MKRQVVARWYVDCVIFVRVSSFSTAIFVSDLRACNVEVSLGTTSLVPAARCVGPTMPGLAATSSCQRDPRPSVCGANFQSASPDRTVWPGTVDTEKLAGGAGGTIEVWSFDSG